MFRLEVLGDGKSDRSELNRKLKGQTPVYMSDRPRAPK